MALVNNIFEFPSDAFKIVTHFRHPLPQRTDTIGPWLDCLSFLAWSSALTNSALVYLFRPQGAVTTTSAAAGNLEVQRANMREVLARTLFIALAASHGFILLRAVVRHVLERVMWYGSEEKKRLDGAAREVKEQYVQSIRRRGSVGGGTPPLGLDATPPSTESTTIVPGPGPVPVPAVVAVAGEGQSAAEETQAGGDEFWQFDEGLDEIRKGIKDS
jgi:anoctamin-10